MYASGRYQETNTRKQMLGSRKRHTEQILLFKWRVRKLHDTEIREINWGKKSQITEKTKTLRQKNMYRVNSVQKSNETIWYRNERNIHAEES